MIYIVLSAGAVAQTVQPAVSGSHQPAKTLDTSGVTDVKSRAVIDQIARTLAGIREYTCTVQNVAATPKGNLTMTEQFWYKSPLMLDVQTVTEHPVATMRGNRTFIYTDGNSAVMHMVPGPGAAQAFVEMLSRSGRMPADQVQRIAAENAKPKAYRYNLGKLRAAGIHSDGLLYQEWVANPFTRWDLATLKLENETADSWTLSCMLSLETGKTRGTFQVSKKDCIIRTAEIDGSAGKTTLSIKDILINPSPGIQDSVFQYTPPPGVSVTDATDQFLKSQKK